MELKVLLVLSIMFGTVLNKADAESVFGVGPQRIDCKVSKFVNGKWIPIHSEALEGMRVTSEKPWSSNADLVSFKIQENWYFSKKACLSNSPSNMPRLLPNQKYFLEASLQAYEPLSKNLGLQSEVSSGSTSTPGAYSSHVGFGGRFGYLWKDDRHFLLDFSDSSGGQTLNYTGAVTGSPTVQETVLTFNLGIQMPLVRKEIFGIKPYISLLAGYARLSGVLSGTLNDGGSGILGVSYSGSGFTGSVELGLLKKISERLSALLNVSGTYLKLTPSVNQSNYAPFYSQGAVLSSENFSRVTISLSARFAFGLF